MQILQQPISRAKLRTLAQNTFGDMIKCVADIRLDLLALDADLHADLEQMLLKNGSAQENLWGFNLRVEEAGEDLIRSSISAPGREIRHGMFWTRKFVRRFGRLWNNSS